MIFCIIDITALFDLKILMLHVKTCFISIYLLYIQKNSLEIVTKSPCDTICYEDRVELLMSQSGTDSVTFAGKNRHTLNQNFPSFPISETLWTFLANEILWDGRSMGLAEEHPSWWAFFVWALFGFVVVVLFLNISLHSQKPKKTQTNKAKKPHNCQNPNTIPNHISQLHKGCSEDHIEPIVYKGLWLKESVFRDAEEHTLRGRNVNKRANLGLVSDIPNLKHNFGTINQVSQPCAHQQSP